MALCRIYPAASIAVSLLVSFSFRQARKRGVALDVIDNASTLLLTSEFLAAQCCSHEKGLSQLSSLRSRCENTKHKTSVCPSSRRKGVPGVLVVRKTGSNRST
ncbi:unnamed protein product [Ixodes persulcatus]